MGCDRLYDNRTTLEITNASTSARMVFQKTIQTSHLYDSRLKFHSKIKVQQSPLGYMYNVYHFKHKELFQKRKTQGHIDTLFYISKNERHSYKIVHSTITQWRDV